MPVQALGTCVGHLTKKKNKIFFSRIVTKQQTNKKKNQPFNLIIQKNSNLSLKEMINKQLGFKLIEG